MVDIDDHSMATLVALDVERAHAVGAHVAGLRSWGKPPSRCGRARCSLPRLPPVLYSPDWKLDFPRKNLPKNRNFCDFMRENYWPVRIGRTIRTIQYSVLWRPLDSAPVNEDVALLVTDGASEPYPLKPASRLTAAGWVSSAKGTPLTVTPVKWKPYSAPRPPRARKGR
jgi:hypothetical protein